MDWNGLFTLFLNKLPEIVIGLVGIYAAYRLPSPDQKAKP